MIRYLSEITEKHIDTISQAIHDTHPEYDYDKFLQIRLYKIGDKLRENPSMYQLSSEEVDLRACRDYRMAIEEILSILKKN